jgi:hypothetical protein
MNKNIWGKHIWKSIHYIALGYPELPTDEDKYNYYTFFISLKNVLPCEICRNHYTDILINKLPLTDDILKNKNNLLKWTIDLHNIVNSKIGKKILSYEDAINIMIDDKEDINNNNIILLFIISFSIIIISIYYIKRK